MAQVTTIEAMTRMVAAKTIQPPQDRWGTNKRISTRKASKVMSRVGMVRISRASR